MVRKLRIQRIVIESTVEKEPVWIHVTGQEIHYDDEGNQLSVLPNNHYVHFMLDAEATTMFDFYDPVTQSHESHSGAGIGIAVTNACLIALQGKYGGTLEHNFLCL